MPTATNVPQATPGPDPVPDALAASQAARAAALESIREGSPEQLEEAFADLETLGDVTPDVDWDELAANESSDPDEQAELDISDDDEPFLDGWDVDPLEQPEVALTLGGGGSESDEDLGTGSAWQFLVTPEGICEFARPHLSRWMRYRPASKAGKDAIGDAERRMQMLERIAAWLTSNRMAFLLNPDPWLLGCDAWKEFKEGTASVVPGHFLVITQLGELCGQSLFSRYRRASSLIWQDATMPLDFLFGREAKAAWVANVVVQAATELGQPVARILDQCKRVTRPKLGSRRRVLSRQQVEHLGWADVIARANDMADTKWSDVLAIHGDRMLQ